MPIRKNLNMIRDLTAGSVALLAMASISPKARTEFCWQIIDRVTRICALDIMKVMAEERSLDEVPPEGLVTEPCRDPNKTDHVHWVPNPDTAISKVLRPVIEQIEEEIYLERFRQQVSDAIKSAAAGEGESAALPFDMNAFSMGLDLSSPDALAHSLEEVLGHPVEVIRHEGNLGDVDPSDLGDDGWADLDPTVIKRTGVLDADDQQG